MRAARFGPRLASPGGAGRWTALGLKKTREGRTREPLADERGSTLARVIARRGAGRRRRARRARHVRRRRHLHGQGRLRERRPAREGQRGAGRRPADRHGHRHRARRVGAGRGDDGGRRTTWRRSTAAPRRRSGRPRCRASPTATSRSSRVRTAAREIDDGGEIAADETSAPVDLDVLFNTLDADTREGLRNVIRGSGTSTTGAPRRPREHQVLRAVPVQHHRLTRRARARRGGVRALRQGHGATTVSAIAERRDDLAGAGQQHQHDDPGDRRRERRAATARSSCCRTRCARPTRRSSTCARRSTTSTARRRVEAGDEGAGALPARAAPARARRAADDRRPARADPRARARTTT